MIPTLVELKQYLTDPSNHVKHRSQLIDAIMDDQVTIRESECIYSDQPDQTCYINDILMIEGSSRRYRQIVDCRLDPVPECRLLVTEDTDCHLTYHLRIQPVINSQYESIWKRLRLLNQKILYPKISPHIVQYLGHFVCHGIVNAFESDYRADGRPHLTRPIPPYLHTFLAHYQRHRTFNLITEAYQDTLYYRVGWMYRNPDQFPAGMTVRIMRNLLFQIMYTLSQIKRTCTQLSLLQFGLWVVNNHEYDPEGRNMYYRYVYQQQTFIVPLIDFQIRLGEPASGHSDCLSQLRSDCPPFLRNTDYWKFLQQMTTNPEQNLKHSFFDDFRTGNRQVTIFVDTFGMVDPADSIKVIVKASTTLDCAICLEPIDNKSTVCDSRCTYYTCKNSKIQHPVHSECWFRWKETTTSNDCVICRIEVNQQVIYRSVPLMGNPEDLPEVKIEALPEVNSDSSEVAPIRVPVPVPVITRSFRQLDRSVQDGICIAIKANGQRCHYRANCQIETDLPPQLCRVHAKQRTSN